MPAPDQSRVARLRALPGFVRFWTADTVSEFGSYITTLALQVLVVVSLHGTATDVGLVNAGRWLPYLLFGLVAGVFVDRVRRRPVLVASDLGRAVLLGAIPLLWAVDLLTVPVLVGFMVAFGVLSLAHDAAYQSYLPRLVPTALLTRANARLEQSASVAQTSGPLVGGGLVGALGAPLAVLVDAVSYLVSGLILVTIRTPEPPPPRSTGHRRRLGPELREGLSWVYRHRLLGPFAVTIHGWFLFNGLLATVFVPYALREVKLDAFGLGTVYALAGVGGLLGSLGSGRIGERLGPGWTITVGHGLMPVAFALVAFAPTDHHAVAWTLLGAGQFLFGLGLGITGPHEMGYRQAVTPDRLQGRMNATMRSLNRAMIVIGAPLGGLLGESIGYRPALWLGVAGFLGAAIALAVSPVRTASYADAAPS